MRTLIVGHGGRESALATRMAEHSELHALCGHENPSIAAAAERSGGTLTLGDVCDPVAVTAAARAAGADIAMVSADEPLQAGVVDALREAGIAAVGPTRAGAEIEWNKAFARELLAEVAPAVLPRLRIARDIAQADAAIDEFGADPIVVKPSGLTGGKGVKVMGPHLASHAEAREYAHSLLAPGAGSGDSVLIEERIDGPEFTIQAISDGRTVVFPPSTYDYPYRFDGDEGPGTGGMGSLALPTATLPFMTAEHYREACDVIERVIARLGEQGRHFSGVMNSGFFATHDGVRVIEFNARFGDPECMNIMSLLDGSWPHVMEQICARTLSPADVPLRSQASVVLYLVSPDYALRGGEPREFALDVDAAGGRGCEVFFSSAVTAGAGRFRTLGTSRAVALAARGDTLEQARTAVAAVAAEVPELEWLRDGGDGAYLDGLARAATASPA